MWGEGAMLPRETTAPVVLVLYDAVGDAAYWLYVQDYLQRRPLLHPTRGAAEVTVRIPRTNVLDSAAVRHFARCRDRVLAQWKGRMHHHEE